MTLERLGAFELQQTISQDHLGTLYLGVQDESGQQVWLKHFQSEHTTKPTLQTRFLEGMRFLQQFQHPKVIRVLHTEQDPDDGIYATFEAVDGKSFSQLLEEGNYFPASRLANLMTQFLQGLEALHQSSLIHGDLHLSSLFIHQNTTNAESKVQILHLGHGWWWSDAIREEGGFQKGPNFSLAPEQVSGAAWDHRIDIYAAGIIFAQLLLGSPLEKALDKDIDPHDADALRKAILEALEKTDHTHPAIKTTLQRTITQTPEERYDSVGELLQGLSECFPSEPVLSESIESFTVSEDEEIDDDDEFQPTQRMELDEALAGMNYEQYMLEHGQDQVTMAGYSPDAADIEDALFGQDNEATVAGYTPDVADYNNYNNQHHDPYAASSPFVAQSSPPAQIGPAFDATSDHLESTYVGPGDIARAAGASEETKPTRWILWAAIPIGVIGFIAIIFYTVRLPTLRRDPPPPMKKVFVNLDLKTSPAGAKILVNGEDSGEITPNAIRARIGTKLLIQLLRKGHKPITFSWEATRASKRQFVLEAIARPRPPPPKVVAKKAAKPKRRRRRRRRRRRKKRVVVDPNSVVLTLRSSPSRAKVIVGNQPWPGKTPLRVRWRRGTPVKVVIRKYGHQDAYFYWNAQNHTSKTIRLYRHSWYNP